MDFIKSPFASIALGMALGVGLSLGIAQTIRHQLAETRATCAALSAASPSGRWCADNGFGTKEVPRPNYSRQASLVGWR